MKPTQPVPVVTGEMARVIEILGFTLRCGSSNKAVIDENLHWPNEIPEYTGGLQ